MFSFDDLFQWERFITPSIIKVFYWLAVAVIVLLGMAGVGSALAIVAADPFAGFVTLLISIVGIVAGVVFVRIMAEFVLIVFRINEHLGAIRNRQDDGL